MPRPTCDMFARSTAVALVLVLLSLQGYSVLLLLEYLPSLRTNPAGVAVVGVVALGGFGLLALYSFRRCGCELSLSAMFFAVTGWSALVDLVLAAALIDATLVGKFYMEVRHGGHRTWPHMTWPHSPMWLRWPRRQRVGSSDG